MRARLLRNPALQRRLTPASERVLRTPHRAGKPTRDAPSPPARVPSIHLTPLTVEKRQRAWSPCLPGRPRPTGHSWEGTTFLAQWGVDWGVPQITRWPQHLSFRGKPGLLSSGDDS